MICKERHCGNCGYHQDTLMSLSKVWCALKGKPVPSLTSCRNHVDYRIPKEDLPKPFKPKHERVKEFEKI